MNPEQITTRATIAELRAGKAAKPRRDQSGQRRPSIRSLRVARKLARSGVDEFGFSHRFTVDAFGRRISSYLPNTMAAAARAYHARDYAEAERCCLTLIEQDPAFRMRCICWVWCNY